MADRVKPFITSSSRQDILADLARAHSDRSFRAVAQLVERAIDFNIPKKDGKDGSKDGGEGGFWDKKDGKEGKDKEKDGKESKEGKEGKENKDGKDQKDGKEGKDKDGKDKDDGEGAKITGTENETYRYGEEVILPAEMFKLITEIHSVRLTSLLNQPIF